MENTITLINIVFLMLIFFLIAGTIAPTAAPEVEAIKTSEAEEAQQEKMLGIRVDGTMIYEGRETTAEAYLAALNAEATDAGEEPVIRLLPDRALPATELLDIVSTLHEAGGGKIVVFSERAQP
ncbi:biopolymer transporter ExbD [Rhizobium sp. L1K21]|uniref:ExbD/TolR family protein n=1 Tax=Rhizobium sp. L1K21 TaxID=2954933 RepID=UPI0020923A69|nr:biopolymer transporter ExbD [Rhizobium sp. L1K21]MCO6185255.1 biopolymer transporter ExbD [Rhizobium sp. L1K21]